jgi:hypothetical protein
MNPNPLLALALICVCGPVWAADSAASAPTPAPADKPQVAAPGEPAVQRTIIDDELNHVEELRVRGQVTRITVSPKYGGRKPYEILPGNGGRHMSEDGNGSRGAAGQRVWNVLKF